MSISPNVTLTILMYFSVSIRFYFLIIYFKCSYHDYSEVYSRLQHPEVELRWSKGSAIFIKSRFSQMECKPNVKILICTELILLLLI